MTTVSEVQLWLKEILINEKLTDISVKILGNTEKGDGYVGDVLFVNVEGKTANDEPKIYDLVLKCSKKSKVLRDTVPIKETFENEIYFYSEICPAFEQFQLEKGIKNVFNSVAKYYGKFTSENMEVLALQNLKVLGYKLYDKSKPLTSDHIKLVVGEYGKWHAISVAMQDQQPETFKKLESKTKDIWKQFCATTDLIQTFENQITEICELLEQDISADSIQKLKEFRNQVKYIMEKLIYEPGHISVLLHGDCWNNNFMYKNEETNEDKPKAVAMLDWQITMLGNPVLDLCYFLYTCISKDDLKKLDEVLREYYTSFSNYVRKLGSDPEKLYTYSDLLDDWKMFAKFGVMMAFAAAKVAATDKDEVLDIADTIGSGKNFSETFSYEVKDKSTIRERSLYIVEHAIEHNII